MRAGFSSSAGLSQSRREFLGRFAGVVLTGLASPLAYCAVAPSDAGQKTVVGSNVYGWGQYAQREGKSLNVQDVLSALRDTGYDYLETFLNVAQPEEGARFAEQCKLKGLQPVSLYVGGPFHETNAAKDTVAKILAAAKVCRDGGFQVLSCNPDPIGREKTDEELKIQAAALADVGVGLKALGMKLGVHQHLPEMKSNAREFHYDFQHTKPDEVGWCYDVHWVWKGGIQPLDALKQYGERVVTWHLRQSRDGVWWEDLDTGDIDYAAVARHAREHNLARRFSVELALESGTRITRSVVENHRRSREFVRKTFGA
jgi:inosose dehydratase